MRIGQIVALFYIQYMAQLLPLRLQIELVELVRWHHNRYSLSHLDPVKLQILQLIRIIRQELDRFHVKRHQHVCCDVVVSFVRPEAQLLVRLNSVETCILQLVGLDLVDETDSPAFLPQIENYPPLHLADSREGFLKLLSTVAP